MTDLIPPSYYESNLEQVPAYEPSSDISARWHIIDKPAKGIFGSRSVSLVSDESAVTEPAKSATKSFKPQNYNLVVIDSLHLEAYEVPPSNAKWKAPLLAHLYFGHGTKANVSFSDKSKDLLTLDAQDLLPESLDSEELRLVTLYQTMSIEGAMPICWSIEPKMVSVRPPSGRSDLGDDTNGGPSANISTTGSDNGAKNKRSWREQFKENLRLKDKRRSQNNAGSSGASSSSSNEKPTTHVKTELQKQTLASYFKLRDAAGNVYAQFTNELSAEKPTSSTVPNVQAQLKGYRSWGYLDIYDSEFACLRSSFDVFTGWSDSDVELLVLLTLFMTLEVNWKVNGDKKPRSVVKQCLVDLVHIDGGA